MARLRRVDSAEAGFKTEKKKGSSLEQAPLPERVRRLNRNGHGYFCVAQVPVWVRRLVGHFFSVCFRFNESLHGVILHKRHRLAVDAVMCCSSWVSSLDGGCPRKLNQERRPAAQETLLVTNCVCSNCLTRLRASQSLLLARILLNGLSFAANNLI